MCHPARMPLFSIVTVARDNLDGLKRTYASVAAQSMRDLEWIAVDGGSADGSAEFLSALPPSLPVPVLWTSGPDGGIYDAMNKGMDRAGGDYLLFLNAGDTLAAADTLERLAAAIAAAPEPPGFVYGDALEDGRYKKARAHAKSAWGMFTHHQAMLYRRETAGDLRYDLSYEIAADYKFTRRVLEKSRAVLYSPFPLCRFEPGGISQRRVREGRREQLRIRIEENPAGLVFYGLVYAAQSTLWALRSRFPGLYWRMKRG